MMNDLMLTPEDAALLYPLLSRVTTRPQWKDSERVQFIGLLGRMEAHARLVPPPLNGDKVWYGLTTHFAQGEARRNQSATIVRAKSQAEAVRLLNAAGDHISVGHFSKYWSVTGNRYELCTATECGIWVNPIQRSEALEDWIKVWPKEGKGE